MDAREKNLDTNSKRRQFTPEKKADAVRRHLRGKEEVSAICQDLGIAPKPLGYRFHGTGGSAYDLVCVPGCTLPLVVALPG